MYVKFILPALTEAKSIYWRSIKYSLFPPLGLATLAGYLSPEDIAIIEDEHVQEINLNDEPDIVAIQAYITSAYRAYELAEHYRKKGAYIVLGGLHVSALPDEAMSYADSIFIGPAEQSWPEFLVDYRKGNPKRMYRSADRTLENMPLPRRELFDKKRYLVPNSIVVSRGCPHRCDFCYKESFFHGGKSFYVQKIDRVLKEIDTLSGKHLFFLDDHLFGNRKFALELFNALRGMNRVWQAAGTVPSVLDRELFDAAVKSGLRSLFVGFETLNIQNLKEQHKLQNLTSDYDRAIETLHGSGVMINGSFIFGMDYDQKSVFEETVDWALHHSIETATFHILTPYPDTKLYARLEQQQRIISHHWNDYDTRHAVFTPKNMSGAELEEGYRKAYRLFYRWSSIFNSVGHKDGLSNKARHLLYTAGWKKFEWLWEFIIRNQKLYNIQ
jgi:radical SAM superfamily enzyme YgiQ (UPF0313 family)